jgi:hypothetical protein
MGTRARRGNQGGVFLSDDVDDIAKPTGIAGLLDHVKENPVLYMVGLLVLQQAGLLSQAATQLQGVCF